MASGDASQDRWLFRAGHPRYAARPTAQVDSKTPFLTAMAQATPPLLPRAMPVHRSPSPPERSRGPTNGATTPTQEETSTGRWGGPPHNFLLKSWEFAVSDMKDQGVRETSLLGCYLEALGNRRTPDIPQTLSRTPKPCESLRGWQSLGLRLLYFSIACE